MIFDLGMDFPKSVWREEDRMISFPAKFVKLSFFTIVKTSQSRHPPDLRNVEHIVQSEMCFAKTRYTVPTMLNSFGPPFLLIISSQDVQLCNLLVKNAHVASFATGNYDVPHIRICCGCSLYCQRQEFIRQLHKELCAL